MSTSTQENLSGDENNKGTDWTAHPLANILTLLSWPLLFPYLKV